MASQDIRSAHQVVDWDGSGDIGAHESVDSTAWNAISVRLVEGQGVSLNSVGNSPFQVEISIGAGQTSFGGDLLPSIDDMWHVGKQSLRWRAGYFARAVSIGTTLALLPNDIKTTSGDLGITTNAVTPGVDNTQFFGRPNLRWNRLHTGLVGLLVVDDSQLTVSFVQSLISSGSGFQTNAADMLTYRLGRRITQDGTNLTFEAPVEDGAFKFQPRQGSTVSQTRIAQTGVGGHAKIELNTSTGAIGSFFDTIASAGGGFQSNANSTFASSTTTFGPGPPGNDTGLTIKSGTVQTQLIMRSADSSLGLDIIPDSGQNVTFRLSGGAIVRPFTDNATDLGSATSRWNSVFFAGGLSVGGTGGQTHYLKTAAGNSEIARFESGSTTGIIRIVEGGVFRAILGYGDNGGILTGQTTDSVVLRSEGDLFLAAGGDNLGAKLDSAKVFSAGGGFQTNNSIVGVTTPLLNYAQGNILIQAGGLAVAFGQTTDTTRPSIRFDGSGNIVLNPKVTTGDLYLNFDVTGSDVFVKGDILPTTDDLFAVGVSGARWRSGYFARAVSVGATLALLENEISITPGSTLTVRVVSADLVLAVTGGGVVRPSTDNSADFGSVATRWKDGKFAGILSAGTYQNIPAATIGTGTSNVIPKFDTSTTINDSIIAQPSSTLVSMGAQVPGSDANLWVTRTISGGRSISLTSGGFEMFRISANVTGGPNAAEIDFDASGGDFFFGRNFGATPVAIGAVGNDLRIYTSNTLAPLTDNSSPLGISNRRWSAFFATGTVRFSRSTDANEYVSILDTGNAEILATSPNAAAGNLLLTAENTGGSNAILELRTTSGGAVQSRLVVTSDLNAVRPLTAGDNSVDLGNDVNDSFAARMWRRIYAASSISFGGNTGNHGFTTNTSVGMSFGGAAAAATAPGAAPVPDIKVPVRINGTTYYLAAYAVTKL